MSLSDIALVTLVQAKNHLRINSAASLHVSAEFIGVGDGTDLTFDLDHTPIEGTLKLYVDNTLQVETINYSISTATITFVVAPSLNKGITANYDYAAGDDTFESYDDLELENLIAAATRIAEDSCGRVFIQREITETQMGNGTKIMKLYKQPVIEVSSINIDGVALSDWNERLSIGRVYHLSVWELYSEIIIVYTAGYGANRAAAQALVPEAVIAVLLIVANLFENRVDQVKQESVTGIGSVTYDVPSKAMKILDLLRVDLI